MNKRWVMGIILSVMAAIFLAGCENQETPKAQEEQSKEQGATEAANNTMEAVCLIYGKREPLRIFAEKKTGSLFDVSFPDGEIYGVDGEKITEDEIPNGAVVKITGDGIMLESYPGQYPGVTRIEVTGQEEEETVQKYLEDIYENYYNEPDPAARPLLDIQYRNSMAAASASVREAMSYDWNYEDYEGKKHHIEKDSGKVVDWEGLTEFDIPAEVEAPGYELNFYEKPDAVKVTVYQEGQEAGKEVSVIKKEDAYYIEEIAAGAVYEIKAVWESNSYFNGWAVYGFRGTDRKN